MTLRHRVDQYATDVGSGKIVAGPYVRMVCERHLKDRKLAARKSGHPLGLFFHEKSANHIIEFFEGVLRLPDTVDDYGDPIPFLLTPANTFIVGSLFGWKMPDDQGDIVRRFREAYVEMGKGNAKTPLGAGIGLYGLVMDGEQAAEIYSVATGIDQARICWLDGDRMVQASPDLCDLIHRGADNLAYAATFSWFRPMTKEKRGKSGPRPHIVIFDEEHEYADAVVVNKMRAGAKRRKQPLFLGITNSGFDRTSICWQHHEHSRKVLEGTIDDPRWFAYVCALDDGDDPLTDEACWPKANPNIGYVIQAEYLRRQVQNARNIPGETDMVLRLNFCVWTNAKTRAIDMGSWGKCPRTPAAADLIGRPAFGGLDLGQSDDFTAWVKIWILVNGWIAVRARFWIPESALLKYPDRPYAQWRRQGVLQVTEGTTTDYAVVQAAIEADCHAFGIRSVGYDKRFADQMAQYLMGRGIDMVETPQGFQLNEAIKRKGELIAGGKLAHEHDPILDWMASNYVVRKGWKGDLRPDKESAADKIDGQVALDMGLSVWIHQPAAPPKQYQIMVF